MPAKTDAKFDVRVELFEWAQALLTAMVAFLLIYAFVARIIGVDGSSMKPTLHNGEKLLISNLFYKPSRGDIIMFTKKGIEIAGHGPEPRPLVKRVIGLPGDVVDIDFNTHVVSVNGQPVDEPYIQDPTAKSDDVVFPVTVPEGCVFVMGDNREVSLDSRSTRVGMIDERCILGHVLFRVYPLNSIGPVG